MSLLPNPDSRNTFIISLFKPLQPITRKQIVQLVMEHENIKEPFRNHIKSQVRNTLYKLQRKGLIVNSYTKDGEAYYEKTGS